MSGQALITLAKRHPIALSASVACLAIVAGSAGLATWAQRAAEKARIAQRSAIEEQGRLRKLQSDLEAQLGQAEVARQAAEDERDQYRFSEQEARRSAEDQQAVLAFLRDKLLSAGRPREWTGKPRNDITLREAVDQAEPQIAKEFAGDPLAEALARSTLGWTYFYLGEAELAVKQFERALALREAELGPGDPLTVGSRNDLARAYRAAGETDKASRLYEQDFHTPSHAAAMELRGSILLDQKRAVQAEVVLRECLALDEEIHPDSWATFNVKSMLGEALMRQRKYADAEPLLLSSYEGLRKRETEIPAGSEASLVRAAERVANLYEAWGKKEEAGRWQKELQAATRGVKP